MERELQQSQPTKVQISFMMCLYVPEIDQNLLSVGQRVKKGYKVLFENKICLIKDEEDNDILKVKMREKSFALNPLEEK